MKFCTRCLYPDTKPDLTFNDVGLCSACQAFDARASTDWTQREVDFNRLVFNIRRQAQDRNADYDCVVPVSGGKDSHYQVLTALDYGLRVLAVTAETDHLSDIGRRNLDNIGKLGVDHLEVRTNPVIRRKISRFTLETVGDLSWAEHVTIFSAPVRVANTMNIPLIIWGENPQNEYGGPADVQLATELSDGWLAEFGGLNGLRVDDVEAAVGPLGPLYRLPEINQPIVRAFLGQFFPWDGERNARVAAEHGFEMFSGSVEGSYGSYENLDNLQTGIHDYFKFLKFGFGRATDILSNHIRRGKIGRDRAAAIAAERDGAFPASYLGVRLREILRPLDLSMEEFLVICDNFTNQSIFTGSNIAGDLRLRTREALERAG